MNLRELISSTPYTTVHAPRRGHIAYSTRKRAGTTAALHHPTDGWSTNRSWMCSLYPHVLDELVHAAAQRRAALTTTTKGTDQ